eukprot:TRINITY_DN9531_c0_g4_i3.p1 TRINITY_DN9531_c0_g4~~TRINITY_DN9531_c0_g4_i3.p1  ORF type:complete len:178 (+),score=27.14 TRINITY_DN9531_c0_g4_i3:662-1195(+)
MSLAFIGLYGTLKLHQNLIALHGFITAGCIGAFFLLEFVKTFFLAGYGEEKKNAVIEQFKLLLLSAPYLIDFLAGIVTLKLFIAMLEVNEEPEVVPQTEQILPSLDAYARNQGLTLNCVICMVRPREMLFLDCGHKCVCKECAEEYLKNYTVCPVCRDKVKRCLKIFNPCFVFITFV